RGGAPRIPAGRDRLRGGLAGRSRGWTGGGRDRRGGPMAEDRSRRPRVVHGAAPGSPAGLGLRAPGGCDQRVRPLVLTVLTRSSTIANHPAGSVHVSVIDQPALEAL